MRLFTRNHKSRSKARQSQLMDGQNDYSFRRSRTLTGSASSNVKTAGENKAQLQSPRQKIHHLRKKRRFIFVILSGVLLFALSLLWMINQYIDHQTPLVVNQESSIISEPPLDEYKKSLDQYFSGRPLERFGFMLDEAQLSRYIIEQHAEIDNISYVAAGNNGAVFTVMLRNPVVGWQLGGDTYYVDNEGFSFTNNYYSEPRVLVKDDSGLSSEGERILVSSRFLGFLGRVVATVNEQNDQTVETVTLPSGTTRQAEIRLKDKPYAILMYVERRAEQQVEDMKNAIKYFDSNDITPRYIDVRVSGKAYYR